MIIVLDINMILLLFSSSSLSFSQLFSVIRPPFLSLFLVSRCLLLDHVLKIHNLGSQLRPILFTNNMSVYLTPLGSAYNCSHAPQCPLRIHLRGSRVNLNSHLGIYKGNMLWKIGCERTRGL